MAAKLVVLLACLALASAGKVRRDVFSDMWHNIEENAQQFGKTFSEQFNALTNSKNVQEVNNALKESSDSVLQQLSTFSNSLQSAMNDANGKAKEVLEQSHANVQRTVDELRKAHPDVEKQAAAFGEKLRGALDTAFKESQVIAKEVAASADQTNQKLAPQFQKAYDDLVKNAQEFQKKVHEAASAKQ